MIARVRTTMARSGRCGLIECDMMEVWLVDWKVWAITSALRHRSLQDFSVLFIYQGLPILFDPFYLSGTLESNLILFIYQGLPILI